jgi:hypothetical protein
MLFQAAVKETRHHERNNMAVVGLLSQDQQAIIAKTEVNEDPDRKAGDIAAIKEWLEKQPHLHNHVREGKKD